MVYGLDHNGDRGEVRGLKNKDNFPFPYDRELWPGMGAQRACVFAFGYGAVEESGGRNRTLSCSVRLTLTAAKRQRLQRETKTGR